ncbi:DNA-binding transcriptional regulator, MarR family [Saccharopolyspora antimicrobica]|uniref:DNA-binding MarR family transcriptional regulator n=1 Tax=Saccharopolyspora antimicrobica TaxID=455193 RepID=A0A1I4WVS3_9PSEU|nr:DNA-binding MarR family transcriptional regulator [Saccharopolyspora antimicrobica]SFN17884.1 DNA-binding transcriptional regulator, MarR family [Saccharopolyspora antimicrobica]
MICHLTIRRGYHRTVPGFAEQDPQRMPLTRLVGLTGRRLSQHWERTVARSTELSRTALLVLNALDHQNDQTHREVARRCWVRPATLTPVVDALAEGGLLTRHRDRNDRRAVRLRITTRGRAELHSAWQAVRAEFQRIEPDVPAAEAAIVRQYLIAVLSGLDEEGGGCDHSG